MLLLDPPLSGRPADDARPLEKDVLRDGGPDSPPVAPVLLGDEGRMGDVGLATLPFRSSGGISKREREKGED